MVWVQEGAGGVQEAALLNRLIATQGNVPSDTFHHAWDVYWFLWPTGQLISIVVSESMCQSGGRVKGETEALMCKWVKGERGRWRGAPHCGLN